MSDNGKPIDEVTSSEKVQIFREMFPEFNANAYPDNGILVQMNIAIKLVNKCAFGDMYNYAVCLVTAHLLILRQSSISSNGMATGDGPQTASSKSVGEVSISYNAPAGYNAENSFSATSYGRMYLDLINLFGVGCIQL